MIRLDTFDELASTLLEEEEPRKLKRFRTTDLTVKFL
jgi:hypothetical protein